MKIYISGPMAGVEDRNYPLFHEVEKALFSTWPDPDTLEVCNPAKNFDGDQTRPISDYLEAAAKQVDEADALVILPGWYDSEGATFEVDRAKKQGKKFYRAFGNSEGWTFTLIDQPDINPSKLPLMYETRDSGERQHWDTGMQRDTAAGKTRFDLLMPVNQAYHRQMVTRWAELMTRGAVKYDARNWEKASTPEEVARFRESAIRHFMQWYQGANDGEDHAAATFFNIAGAEYAAERVKATKL